MAAVDSDVTPATRTRFELLESIAVVNQTPDSVTVHRALEVPVGVRAVTFLVDMLIGNSGTFAFQVFGATTAGGRTGALLDSTTDIWPFATTAASPASAAITTITTDTSTPISALSLGQGLTLDVTGAATTNAHYSFPAILPTWLIYQYVKVDSNNDADFTGTISAIWDREPLYGMDKKRTTTAR